MTRRYEESMGLRTLAGYGSGGAATIACIGEIDMATAPQFDDAVHAVLDQPIDSLTIDLTEVTFFGSHGIRSLLTARDRCAHAGVELDVRLSMPVRRVLQLTGLSETTLRTGSDLSFAIRPARMFRNQLTSLYGVGD